MSFLLLIWVLPASASDTTTTEVGAQVEQVIQIAPAGQAPADGLNASLSNCWRDGVEAQTSVNGGGDSVTIGVKPKDNSYTSAMCAFNNYFGLRTNVEADISVKADTDFHNTNSDNKYDLVYVGDNPNPEKSVSKLELNIQKINNSSVDIAWNGLPDDGTRVKLADHVPAGEYLGDANSGAKVYFKYRETQPANMPAGFYKAKIIWTATASQ